MTSQETQNKIREICTYYSDLGDGTAGYNLSEEQFQKLFELFEEFAEKREKEVRQELIKKYKPTLDDAYATDWLRSTYGLDDDSTLNAGEVEELLEMFIHDHSKAKEENQK